MPLLDQLIARINTSGPMPFEEFMEVCLYDLEDGFFATGPLRSTISGDFLTSPEVSSWFGRTLGRFVASEQHRLGRDGFFVADVGAGSGSLLKAVAREIEFGSIDVWAVDRSPAARAALSDQSDWVVGKGIADLPEQVSGVILANELLDNLPTALAVWTGNRWEERFVGIQSGALSLVRVPARTEVSSWSTQFGGIVPDGGMVEVQLAAGDWLRAALGKMRRGSIVIIDYGGTAEELEPRRTRGTLRTYRAHHLGPDPLLEPGKTDITSDVNFSSLMAIAAEAGCTIDLYRQDDFLEVWGLREEIRRLRHQELDLARQGDPIERLKVRSQRIDIEALVHPRGLGDFRVLVLGVA